MAMFRLAVLGVAGGVALPVLLSSREQSMRQEQIDAVEGLRAALPVLNNSVKDCRSPVVRTPLPAAASSFFPASTSGNSLVDVQDRAGEWWNRMVFAGHTQFVEWFFPPPSKN